jgi:hypothetical protein
MNDECENAAPSALACFSGLDAELAPHRGELGVGPVPADEARVEAGQVLLHARRVVALGIDGDVHDLQLARLRAELLARLREHRERGRAHSEHDVKPNASATTLPR